MSADRSVSIKVTGLAELARGFRQLNEMVLLDGLKASLLAIAEQVAARARGLMPRRSGHAAESVRAHSSSRGASISLGGQAAPYAPWLDFGGSVGRGHLSRLGFSGAIKRNWLGRPVGEGRYLYPAIRAEHDHIVNALEKTIGALASEEGF